MRSLGTRRAALVAGAATVAVIALAGCSAGQVAETALLDTPISGVDAQNENSSVLVRNLQVAYPGVKGYTAGANAELELSLYNQTTSEITVAISSRPLDRPQVVAARQVGLVSGAGSSAQPGEQALPSAEASHGASPDASHGTSPDASHGASADASHGASHGASPEAAPSSAPATPQQIKPAQIRIPALGKATFRPGDAESLQVVGLTGKLAPGGSVNLVFEFSNNTAPLEIQAPVAMPLTPAPRETGKSESEGH